MDDSGIAPIPPEPKAPPISPVSGSNANTVVQSDAAAIAPSVNGMKQTTTDPSSAIPVPFPVDPVKPVDAANVIQPSVGSSTIPEVPLVTSAQPSTAPVSSTGQTKEGAPFEVTQPKVVAESRGGGEKPAEHIEEIPTQVELEKKPELAGYVEKVEHQTDLTKPVQDDYTQQILLKSTNPQDVTVRLPLTEEQLTMGLHEQVFSSLRWLAEWCVRQIKIMHGKVKYRGEE